MNEKIVIRDFRKGDRYQIDNLFIDQYARKVGPYAVVVYNILCRHSNNKTQQSYPGRELMAEKMNTSIKTVERGIDKLKEFNIINVKRSGKRLNNVYELLDRSEWKK